MNTQQGATKSRNTASSSKDPRLRDLGRILDDEFSTIQEKYKTPKYPLVLVHGLFGFERLLGVEYWQGIDEALELNGVEIIIATVPPAGTIAARAVALAELLAKKAPGKSVNIIAYSMVCDKHVSTDLTKSLAYPYLGVLGLDARYMISHVELDNVKVLSLTTLGAPHQGSAYVDHLIKVIGDSNISRMSSVVKALGFESGGFRQLRRQYVREQFNLETLDIGDVKYFSYGATIDPPIYSVWRRPSRIIRATEGPNDGLTSVHSSKWGDYKGTLEDVSHMDMINWPNRLKWTIDALVGRKPKFNVVAFYLDIADMLATCGF